MVTCDVTSGLVTSHSDQAGREGNHVETAITVDIDNSRVLKRANPPCRMRLVHNGCLITFTVRESPGTAVELFLSDQVVELMKTMRSGERIFQKRPVVTLTAGHISGVEYEDVPTGVIRDGR